MEGAHYTARKSLEIIRQVLSHQRYPSQGGMEKLLEAVMAVGTKLIAANPTGPVHFYSLNS